MSTSQIAENYQLKWHSHLTNLNSSVATLFRTDKFADVLLFTSQSDGGSGIPAHKIILSSCSHFFAQIFESNPAPPNSMVYIVLPPELSKRSIQILIQYMYSGEATVSNDILNEVLHGGELLKIRGLCRNKHSNLMTSVNETTTAPLATATATTTTSSSSIPNEATCEKSLYDQHMERLSNNTSNSNLSIIKESPVIRTSPPHIGSATIGHKSSSVSTTPGLCAVEPDIPKRSSLNYGLKSTVVRNHCAYATNNAPLHMKSSGQNTSHNELSHMPPPVQQITSSTSSSLMHSPDSHSSGGNYNPNNPNGNRNMAVKKESMTINTMNTINDDSINVPNSHYIPIQITASSSAVKKSQQISEKRCANSTSHHYQKAHITHHDPQTANEMHNQHIENGNNSTATIITTTTNTSFVRRYSDDYFATDDLLSGNHLHHHQHAPQAMEYSRKSDKDQQQHQKHPRNSTSGSSYDKIESPIQSIQMMDEMQTMAIKQEPIEWTDFEHDNGSIEKANIEVAVKPELIYSKEDADDDATEPQESIYSPLACELCSQMFAIPAEWVRHIESHAEPTHCVPKKRKRIESSSLTENIAALRCDLCEMYFATPAEWVRHVQNHTETELALSNSNASLRQTSVNNTTSNVPSHRSSRPQAHHIESTKYSHTQTNSHR